MHFEVSDNPNSPIICNVPHAGAMTPDALRADFYLDDDALGGEVLLMADNYTNLLYGDLLAVASSIIATTSRIVVDIERFADDSRESMASVGMGAFYTLTSSGTPLRNVGPHNRPTLEAIYQQYHDAFSRLVQSALKRHGRAIIVDCHSFPSTPRPYEPDQAPNRPAICIGADNYHTPPQLTEILTANFTALGYTVATNSPFAGSIVPMEFYQKEKCVTSVMIEVNRKLYMDEVTFQTLPGFGKVAHAISRTVIKSLNAFASL